MESKAELKKRGFLKQQEGYTLHFCVPAGQLMAGQIKAMAEIADKYGTGQINLTVRQSIKIPFIAYEDIGKVEEEIQKADLKIAAYGRSISNITACPGSPTCKNSCIDTGKLATVLDEALAKDKLPCLVKIGIVGCKNNCLKGIKNDICIIGEPVYEKDIETMKREALNNISTNDIATNNTAMNNISIENEDIEKKIEYRIELSQLDMENKKIVVENEEQLVEKIRSLFRLYEENAILREKFSDVMRKILDKKMI